MIGVGTRWSDFTTASKSAFQDPDVRFVNVNVASFDAAKHSGLPVLGDARVALEELRDALAGYRVAADVGAARAARRPPAGREEVARLVTPADDDGGAADAGGDHRRDQRRRRRDRRGRVRGRLGAGRPAQALARARPRGQGLPRRVRLLVHGLRDPRRHRRQARRARARGVRPRRRRLLPDAPRRARHRGRRADPDRRRARRQPRVRVDRRAVAVGRLGRLRHALPLRANGSPAARRPGRRRARRRRPTRCRSTSPPTPRASARA